MHNAQGRPLTNPVPGTEKRGRRSAAAHRDGTHGMTRIPRRNDPESGFLSRLYRHLHADRLHVQAKRESERLIASMPLPDPFDFDQLVGNIAEARGRQIVMKPLPDHLTGLDGLCGLLVKHDTHPVDLILHPKGCSPRHELTLQVHQLVHLWAGDNTGMVGSPDILRTHAGTPDSGLSTTGPPDHDALIELRADNAARLIGQMSRHRPAGGGRPPRDVPHRGGAPPPGRESRQPQAGPITPSARSRHRPRSSASSRR